MYNLFDLFDRKRWRGRRGRSLGLLGVVRYVVRAAHCFEDSGKGVLNVVRGIALVEEAEEEYDIVRRVVARREECLLIIRGIRE